MILHVTPITTQPAYLVKVAPNSYLPFPGFGMTEMAAQKLKLEASKVIPVFEGWTQAEFQITDKYWAELPGGKPYADFNQTPRKITGIDIYPGCISLMLQIEVKAHNGQLKQWDCLDIRGFFVDPLSKQEVETRRALLTDAQYVVIDEWSKAMNVHNLPADIPGHISKREAKRAMRQIEKLLAKGDGSMGYYSEWAHQNGQDAPLGILAFGSGLDDKHNKRAPQHSRYGFSSWLWKVAEALGYECTDMDQTSRCEDCNGAIDDGSSTPDHYSIIGDCSIVCGKCLNNGNIADGINGSSFGNLSWKPDPARTDAYMLSIYGNLIEITFEHDGCAERFRKDHLLAPTEYWAQPHWNNSFRMWFRHNNLKNESLAQYGKPDEWAVYRAHINWPGYSRYEDCSMRAFWDFVEREVDEQKYPLLWYLAKGKIEDGLLFHCEIELLESLLVDWNEGRSECVRLKDLNHAELQYSEIEELN